MSINEKYNTISHLNDNNLLKNEKFIVINNTQDNEFFKNSNNDDLKNEYFLNRINKKFFKNSSGDDMKPSTDNISISLNKDSLYETFSLFQQFLNSSKIENRGSDDGKIDQQKMGKKIQEFLFEKRNENIRNSHNNKYNRLQNNNIYNTIKKDKNYFINEHFIRSVDDINKYKIETDNNNDVNNNIKNEKEEKDISKIEKNNFLNNSSIEKFLDNNKISLDLKKIYNIEEFQNFKNRKRNQKEKKNYEESIILCKSNNNILKPKNSIVNYFSNKFEEEERIKNNTINNFINDNKIMKANSFSKNTFNHGRVRDINKNKFQNSKFTEKRLGSPLMDCIGDVSKEFINRHQIDLRPKKNKNLYSEQYNKNHHSNSCASYFKNTFFDNNINISPTSQRFERKNTFNNIKKNKNNKNKNNIINRNDIIFSMKKLMPSKTENIIEKNDIIKSIDFVKENKNLIQKTKNQNKESYQEKKMDDMEKYKNDNININLNINQEINNINYSSEKPLIDSNYQHLIKINKNIDKQNRNNNMKSGEFFYNKSSEFGKNDSLNNNLISKDHKENSNNNKTIVMTEIKVKKKKNLSTKEQIIEAKIKELNEEIEKFKEERNKITLLKNEYEKLSEKLKNDIEEFNIKKEEFEKYRQSESEIIKNKKNISVNQPFGYENTNKIIISLKNQNQNLIQNSKKDKETIKELKLKIFDLENIIKQKDNEIKKIKNSNIITTSKKELFENKKINEQMNKKNIDKGKTKNININKDVGFEIKNLFEKKISNNNVKMEKNHDFNNFTITKNFSKIYYDNINKSITKIRDPNCGNISFTQNHFQKKDKKKISSNNQNNKVGNIKSTFEINKVIRKKKINTNNNEYKLSEINCSNINPKDKNNKIIVSCTERNSSAKRIKFPKIKLDYSEDTKKILEFGENEENINYNTINGENNIFKNIKTIPEFKRQKNNLTISTNYPRNNNKISSSYKNRISKPKEDLNLSKHYKDKINRGINSKGKDHILNSSNDIIDEAVFKKKEKNKYLNINKEKKVEYKNNNENDFIIINNDYEKDENENDNDNENEKEYDFIIPEKYSKINFKLKNTIESDGKIINLYTNNKKEIIFQSGVKKEIFDDGYQLVHFPNGDMKQSLQDGKKIYYFFDAKTVQTTFPNGVNVFKFNNNQIEKHYPDGSKFIIFPDGSKRRVSKDGIENNYLSDEEEIDIKNQNKFFTEDFNIKGDSEQLFMSEGEVEDNKGN